MICHEKADVAQISGTDAMALIAERVEMARRDENPWVIARMHSGWAVMGDVQFLPGYCLLLADPVVPSLNDLTETARMQFMQDMVILGDALLAVAGAFRINYEILGNSEPELHAHIFPRYTSEPVERRRSPAWFYDWRNAVAYSEQEHGSLKRAIRSYLLSTVGMRRRWLGP
jgi:diadenosine tetraphosphate (Ap4A) HIT family hydrolase